MRQTAFGQFLELCWNQSRADVVATNSQLQTRKLWSARQSVFSVLTFRELQFISLESLWIQYSAIVTFIFFQIDRRLESISSESLWILNNPPQPVTVCPGLGPQDRNLQASRVPVKLTEKDEVARYMNLSYTKRT